MNGYTKFGVLAGNQPEYAIFPRFQPVRALRLARLSAEITQLCCELGLVMQLDRSSDDPEKRLFEVYHRKLQQSIKDPHSAQQVQLWDTLSAKLKEHGTPHPSFASVATPADTSLLQARLFSSTETSSFYRPSIRRASRTSVTTSTTLREETHFSGAARAVCGMKMSNRISHRFVCKRVVRTS